MAGVDISVSSDNSQEFANELKKGIEAALEAVGLAAEGYAKLECPVGTPESTGIPGYIGGTLRNSITHEVSGDSVYIGTNVEYGKFVELGTYKMAARPFLKPAAEDHGGEYSEIFRSYLGS